MARRRLGLVLALVIGMLSLPGLSLAAQPDGSCGAGRGMAYTMPIPDALRTEGVHRFQFRITLPLPDGTPDVFFTDNQIEVSTFAAVYDNLHLRLVRNRGPLPDRTVDPDVHLMRPDQPAAFYAQLSLAKEDAALVAASTLDVRWEGRRNRWSEWTRVPSGPVNSFCVQTKDSILLKSYGWAA